MQKKLIWLFVDSVIEISDNLTYELSITQQKLSNINLQHETNKRINK